MNNITEKRKIHIVVIIAVVIVIVLLALLKCCDRSPADSQSETEASSKTLDFTPKDGAGKSIQIPAVTGINLKSGQLEQTVDFFNPSGNNCYFVLSLYLSDDTLIYQSGKIAPSEHITDITLLQALERGIYGHCRLVYHCYAMDGETQLNGTDVVLEINSY